MENCVEYKIDGLILKIPRQYDKRAMRYIEDYREFLDKTIYTPNGYPVMFAGEDACKFAEEETEGGCPDCGSCKFYKRAGEHTLIGICVNEYKKIKEDK